MYFATILPHVGPGATVLCIMTVLGLCNSSRLPLQCSTLSPSALWGDSACYSRRRLPARPVDGVTILVPRRSYLGKPRLGSLLNPIDRLADRLGLVLGVGAIEVARLFVVLVGYVDPKEGTAEPVLNRRQRLGVLNPPLKLVRQHLQFLGADLNVPAVIGFFVEFTKKLVHPNVLAPVHHLHALFCEWEAVNERGLAVAAAIGELLHEREVLVKAHLEKDIEIYSLSAKKVHFAFCIYSCAS